MMRFLDSKPYLFFELIGTLCGKGVSGDVNTDGDHVSVSAGQDACRARFPIIDMFAGNRGL